ncbi:uncharacterized protein [Dermacentor andersoni]|uniref:uncharacterized protein isoform X1 n=1 Tax=Dermacentor andersoni TaxID=34620 RepID=UPI002417F1DF|nr:uncharacterized protein LOC126538796 isoform X1 [Dermacentor andersoni]
MGTTFKPVTHVLFDLDGVILDADRLYTAAAEAVAERHGKKYTWELKMRVMGIPDIDAARVVIDTLKLPLSVDQYLAELDRFYMAALPKAQLMPGAERLVRHLEGHGIPIALTSSSKPVSFGMKMTCHGSLLSLFHHVFVSGGDPEVSRGKPHPDIFRLAASKFAEDPAPGKVLVFEDTPAGVTAALEAGMQVVMVPDARMDQENRSRATLCIDSLLDFKPELFGLPPFEEVPKRKLSRSGSTFGLKTTTSTTSTFKPVSHVIFDLDGLLLDTEKLYTGAAETVASRYGKKFTWGLKKRVMGMPDDDAARTIVEGLGLPLTPDEYMAAVDKIYKETFPNAHLMPGADRLVRHLYAHGIPMAIATSSKPATFDLKMMRHREFLALFHHVVCSGGDPEVERGKPHPDIFLVTASKFDKKPASQKVLVFEDSTMGVTAALAAGMQVVMVPDSRMDEDSKRRATTCINTLMDFKPELFGLPPFEDGPSAGPSHSEIKQAQKFATNRKVSVTSFKPVSHVIFNVDGLLLDTEKLYTGAAEKVASQYGKKLTSELKRWVLGTPDTDTARRIVEKLGLPITPDGFMEAMEPICQKVLPTAELMPGADRIVRHLHANGIPMAVTTTSKRPSFDLKMTRHQDLLTLFHHVVCSGGEPDVNRGKPQPDIFLVTASRFDKKALPEKVLVFENSPMGVEAALAAGMQVVMVSAPRVDEENPRQATVHLTSLLEFKPELFGLPSFPDSPKKK